MNTNLHLDFTGQCDQAFSFYETVFGTQRKMTLRWSEVPGEYRCPEGSENLVMHTALQLGTLTLMGADAPPGHVRPFGGFNISLESSEDEIRRLFAALSEGGSTRMPLGPTFWTPLFGMCTDRFGVQWMLNVPGPQPA